MDLIEIPLQFQLHKDCWNLDQDVVSQMKAENTYKAAL
jgi:hypothetical protein